MTRPVWFLDVDGVLNAIAVTPSTRVWPSWGFAKVGNGGATFSIKFAHGLMEGIRDLHGSGLVDIMWLTTWENEANLQLREELGLPVFPVAGCESEFPRDNWWKLPVAQRVMLADPSRPLIWTDDDLRHVPEAVTWAASLDSSLLICPNEWTGLTPEHLERIREFVSREL